MSTVAGPDLVVDACLVVKWYIPEIHSTEAERFLPPAFTLHVPDLFYPEIGNILRNKAVVKRPHEITAEEGRRILDEILRLPLPSVIGREHSFVNQRLAIGNAVVEIDSQGRDCCPANRSAAHKARAVPLEMTVPFMAPRIE